MAGGSPVKHQLPPHLQEH